MANLQYHQATFDMLNRTPVFSEAAISALDKREQELGIKFPASVREWFSIEGIHKIFHYYSNDDHLCEITDIGKKREPYDDEEDFYDEPEEYYDQSLLAFLLENQGVFEMSFRLDGSDDPPVWVWDDDHIWREVDKSFSRFIYIWIWDFLYYRSHYIMTADGARPSPVDLSILRTHLKEVLPDAEHHLHCFEGVGQHLKIDLSYDDKIVWRLETASAETLYDLAKIVIQCEAFSTKKFNSFRVRRVSNKSGIVLERLINEYKENEAI
jgi:hypothetical protein